MASTGSNKTAPTAVRRKAAAKKQSRPSQPTSPSSEFTTPNGGSGRQRWAKPAPRPISAAPAAHIAEPVKVRRKPMATPATRPTRQAPSASTIPSNGGDDGHAIRETQPTTAVAAICRQLAAHQRKRKFCIKSQSMHDRSVESLIASVLGFRLDASEAERKRVFGEAKRIRLAVEKGGDGQHSGEIHNTAAVADLTPVILTNAASRSGWDDMRERVEKEMARLVRQLPVYPFASAINGLGDKGLAIIVGESGISLSEWRTTSGLWKHMGLAVIDGYRQKGKTGKRESDDERQKYFDCPERRGQIIGAIADPLFKAQWAAAKDEDGNNPEKSSKPIAVPAHPNGQYGEIYAHRRAATEPRIAATEELPLKHPDKWTKGRCFNDARRVMIKELLADLRTAWRLAERDAALAAGGGHHCSETQKDSAPATNSDAAMAAGDGQNFPETQLGNAVATHTHPEQSGAGGQNQPETQCSAAPSEMHSPDAATAAGDGHNIHETQLATAVATHPGQSGAGGHDRTETHRGYAPGDAYWSHNTALADVPREALDRIAAITTAADGAKARSRPIPSTPRRSHSRQSDAKA